MLTLVKRFGRNWHNCHRCHLLSSPAGSPHLPCPRLLQEVSLVTFHAKRTLQDNPDIRQREKRKQKKEEERVDDNPVYALYEVHDDPVAEVGTQPFIFCNLKENQSGFFSFRQ